MSSYIVHVFWEQTATAALSASLVHKHSEVRFVAQVDLGSSSIKHFSYTNKSDPRLMSGYCNSNVQRTLAYVMPKPQAHSELERQPQRPQEMLAECLTAFGNVLYGLRKIEDNDGKRRKKDGIMFQLALGLNVMEVVGYVRLKHLDCTEHWWSCDNTKCANLSELHPGQGAIIPKYGSVEENLVGQVLKGTECWCARVARESYRIGEQPPTSLVHEARVCTCRALLHSMNLLRSCFSAPVTSM